MTGKTNYKNFIKDLMKEYNITQIGAESHYDENFNGITDKKNGIIYLEDEIIYQKQKGDDTMVKLNEEAIDELMTLLNKVKGVQKLLKKWGIYIDSDCWNATSFDRDKEDILIWEREDFENLELNGNGDKFFIGGNIVTGSQHEYNNKWILAPKKLAEVQSEIFTDYLMDIMDSVSLKHFELEFDDEFGLIDNCGWEHHICIDAIVKESALTKDRDDMVVKVKDISEIFTEEKEKHLNKDVYVIINQKKIPIKWVHHIGNDIILTI